MQREIWSPNLTPYHLLYFEHETYVIQEHLKIAISSSEIVMFYFIKPRRQDRTAGFFSFTAIFSPLNYTNIKKNLLKKEIL